MSDSVPGGPVVLRCANCGKEELAETALATWYIFTTWQGDASKLPPPEATKAYCSEPCLRARVELPPGAYLVRKDGPEAEWFKRMTARTLAADPHVEAIFESRAAREQREYEEETRLSQQIRRETFETYRQAKLIREVDREQAPPSGVVTERDVLSFVVAKLRYYGLDPKPGDIFARISESDPGVVDVTYSEEFRRKMREFDAALRTSRRISEKICDANDRAASEVLGFPIDTRKYRAEEIGVHVTPNLLGDLRKREDGTIDLASHRNPWASPKSDPITDVRKSLGVHEAEVIPFPDARRQVTLSTSPTPMHESVLSYGEKSWPVEELAEMDELPAELRALGITRVVREPGGRYRIF